MAVDAPNGTTYPITTWFNTLAIYGKKASFEVCAIERVTAYMNAPVWWPHSSNLPGDRIERVGPKQGQGHRLRA